MLSALISVIRLVWPFIRELLFKNKGVKHSIEKNKDLNILFGLYVGMFALSLFVLDHAISDNRYYTDKLAQATVALDRFGFTQQLLNESREEVKKVTNQADSLRADLKASNDLVIALTKNMGPQKAEAVINQQLQTVDTPGQRRTLRDRLKELNSKYDNGRPP